MNTVDGSFAVQMDRVSFSYAGADTPALADFSLNLYPGECVLLCGASGCGKTTVTRLINGLAPHFYEGKLSGKVMVGESEPNKVPLESLAGKVGSVFQNPRSQFFCVDTTSEIAFGCENMGLPEDIICARIKDTAEQMKIEKLLGRNIFNLSGGEKQKIACAGVAAMEPDVFVLDEPTSNLDLGSIRELRKILLLWKRAGKTIVIAEHRLGWLKGICDRVFLLKDGMLLEEYGGEAFFQKRDEELYLSGLRGLSDMMDLAAEPVGFYSLRGTNSADSKENMIISDFNFWYGKRRALSIESLKVPIHAVVAVVGHNGAGKSTFAECLCGLKKGFGGRVTVRGKIYKGKGLRQLSYLVMQDVNHQLFSESVLDEVMLGMETENEEQAVGTLEQLGLADLKDRHPMSLSGGQKQRTAVAAAMLSDRPVLILDEPTSGLDFRHMRETAKLIQMARAEKTIFIVTHDMELIDLCCTHVLHMENGQIISSDKR